MVGHGGRSAGSYLADPTSPIPSHCASIVVTSTVRVKTVSQGYLLTHHKQHYILMSVDNLLVWVKAHKTGTHVYCTLSIYALMLLVYLKIHLHCWNRLPDGPAVTLIWQSKQQYFKLWQKVSQALIYLFYVHAPL